MNQTETKTVKLYVIEEQEIYREIYKSLVSDTDSMLLQKVTSTAENGSILQAVTTSQPDVVLLSTKKLNRQAITDLEQIRTDYPKIGIVLLLMFCNGQDIDHLRRLALKGEGGMALFLKQSLDQTEQLYRTILAVSQGQVILDPPLASFMFAGKPECPFLKQLTTREMEILGLLSQGFTNMAIAGTLFIDVKTVEHHLNSMYSKLKADSDYNHKHLRVSAAKLYLETMGETHSDQNMLTPALTGKGHARTGF
ncbi:MAG: response regulator transcription factor [Chloroflexota bacterium]